MTIAEAVESGIEDGGAALGPVSADHGVNHVLGGEISYQRSSDSGQPDGHGEEEQDCQHGILGGLGYLGRVSDGLCHRLAPIWAGICKKMRVRSTFWPNIPLSRLMSQGE